MTIMMRLLPECSYGEYGTKPESNTYLKGCLEQIATYFRFRFRFRTAVLAFIR